MEALDLAGVAQLSIEPMKNDFLYVMRRLQHPRYMNVSYFATDWASQ